MVISIVRFPIRGRPFSHDRTPDSHNPGRERPDRDSGGHARGAEPDEGSRIVARVEDGVLLLEPIEAAIRRAQAMAAPYGAAGVSLADELTSDRRAAADRE